MTERFVIALNRGKSDAGWQDRVAASSGVQVVGSTKRIMQVEADASAIGKLRDEMGDLLVIEPEMQRSP